MEFRFRDQDALRSHYTVTATQRRWRVVIAEDEALPAELLKRTIMRLGHTVVGSAQNGVEAIALTRQHRPDVVVMDLRMPVMDGWTAMAELTREPLAPVIVVSALDDREAVEQAILAGASGYLTKPVREDDLERALELAIARFADLQEIRRLRAAAEEDARTQAQQLAKMEQHLHDLREAQLRLAAAARRAAVTSLAHGLAHEINNALTPIIGNAQIIGLMHQDQPETVMRVQQILDQAQRIASWTASFRQMTMGNHPEQIPFSFNGIASEVFQTYADRFDRMGISAQLDLDNTLPVMTGYPDQIQELLMLLTQNAVEAQRGAGTIQLTTMHQPRNAEVLATLRDSGVGIAQEHLAHVFEPGFTTKTGSTSTLLGWGLYAAKHIVTSHHGAIDIGSAGIGLGGTQVRVVLPLNPPPVA